MTVFFLIIALFTALALLLVLRPLLLRPATAPAASSAPGGMLNLAVLRDQLRELDNDLAANLIDSSAHASARAELEQRVAQDVLAQDGAAAHAGAAGPAQRWLAAALSLAVVLGAGALYFKLGTPAAFQAGNTAFAADAAPGGASPHAAGAGEAEAMVAKLAERLAKEPKNPEGWVLLARSYSSMNRFVAASAAYAQLMQLIPDDAQLLADYADVLAMTQNQSLRGAPEALLVRALAADPNNIKALVLMGDAAYERGDAAGAIGHWQAVLPLAPPNSELARMAQANIEHARAGASGIPQAPPQSAGNGAPALPANSAGVAAPAPVAAVATAVAPAAAAAATRPGQVAGTVELAPALRAQADPNDTVFIFARAADAGGPRFPLAILRKQVRDLPLQFVLDDTMGMMPEVKLSGFKQLVVGARISKSGSATAGTGDLEGIVEAVPNGSANVRVRIATRRP